MTPRGQRDGDRIAPYRAGYTPQQRREIERRLADGELLGVVSTSALELGIDIGHLDAAMSITFPGTVASLRQQWGRAGRREKGGLAIYVAGDDALDQFFCRHPEKFLERPVESAILDHASENIYMRHLLAAAYEAPLEPADRDTLGADFETYAKRLVSAGELRERDGRYLPRKPGFPAGRVSLRSASPDSFTVLEAEAGEILGFVEAERAFSTVHPGAIYLHLGEPYEVLELDIASRRAIVRAAEGDYYTQPKIETETFIEKLREGRDALGVELRFGIVSVMEEVVAFQRKRLSDHEVIDLHTLDLPEQNFVTQALWYELGEDAVGELPLEALLGSLHATEHAQIAVLPLLAMCDRWDIGGLSTNYHHQTGRPTIFIYDGHPGGVGITRQGFDRFERLVGDARALIGECPCETGCPSCVQSPKCGNLNEPLSKRGALELMGWMIERAEMSETRRYAAVIGPARCDDAAAGARPRRRRRAGQGGLHRRDRRREGCHGGRVARSKRSGRSRGRNPSGDRPFDRQRLRRRHARHGHRSRAQPLGGRIRRRRRRGRRRMGHALRDRAGGHARSSCRSGRRVAARARGWASERGPLRQGRRRGRGDRGQPRSCCIAQARNCNRCCRS